MRQSCCVSAITVACRMAFEGASPMLTPNCLQERIKLLNTMINDATAYLALPSAQHQHMFLVLHQFSYVADQWRGPMWIRQHAMLEWVLGSIVRNSRWLPSGLCRFQLPR